MPYLRQLRRLRATPWLLLAMVAPVIAPAGPNQQILIATVAASTGLTEQVWQSNAAGTDDVGFLSAGSAVAQKIKGIQTSTITITKLDILVTSHLTNGDITVELRANADGTGTLYGTSAVLAITAAGTKTFTFASASVPASTDFHLWFICTGEEFIRIKYVDPWLNGQGYDVIVNGNATPSGVVQDLEFALYAMLP